MIKQFGHETALLLIDVQVGVDVLSHWGGPTGRRNNPDAESRMRHELNPCILLNESMCLNLGSHW